MSNLGVIKLQNKSFDIEDPVEEEKREQTGKKDGNNEVTKAEF